MTSGGADVTSGSERRARLVAFAIFGVLGLAFAVVNALSELDERSRMGHRVEAWEPWCWELSSFAGFLVIAPLVFRLSQLLRPPLFTWGSALALHVLLTLPASLAHVAVMIGLRHGAYAALGDSYSAAGTLLDVLVYEYRKDLISYAVLAALPHVAARLIEARRGAAEPRSTDYRIEVRDGSRTVRLAPADVEWAQAAGNYVELFGPFGTLLHRQTLAALEAELKPHGFARVHRSRIVRAAAIRAIETRASGDFELQLASGAAVSGSRRYRANLA